MSERGNVFVKNGIYKGKGLELEVQPPRINICWVPGGGGGYLTTPVGVILHLFRFLLPYRSFVKETFGQHNSLLSGVDTFPPGGCTALFSLNKLQVLLNGS